MGAWNWVTTVLVVLLIGSTLQGVRRRFATQLSSVVAKAISLVIGLFALWLAWKGSKALADVVGSGQLTHVPQFVQKVIDAWQRAPHVAQLIVFVLVYWLVSGILSQFLQHSSHFVVRALPRGIGQSRILGGLLGIAVGGVWILVTGAVVFVALQYLSLPSLKNQTRTSGPYQWLTQTVYDPYLSPMVKREMPVLAKTAFSPLVQNINLFVLPSGKAGEQRGVLVVPESIARLARGITDAKQTPRQKAYALYEWEIHHIHYDWKKYNDYVYKHQWDQQSPTQTVQTGTGVCADYALLYADLAHSVGLTVQIDEGQGGTSPSNIGSHAWNQVYDPIAKRWMTVDTTWGSEQDTWFDVPLTTFSRTHFLQTAIRIDGSAS